VVEIKGEEQLERQLELSYRVNVAGEQGKSQYFRDASARGDKGLGQVDKQEPFQYKYWEEVHG